ncbi:MAG: ATP-binding cassette domain-containing protein [Pseudomonadota bacterium]
MLNVNGLNVYFGSQKVLDQVSLDLPTGIMAGLIGRNGAGKTTFMRAVMGLIKRIDGAVVFDGLDFATLPTHRRAGLGVGYMPEDRKLVPEFTAEENVLLPAWSTRMENANDRLQWVYQKMPEVAGFRERRANQLSGGQQKLVALARALLCGNKMLLLDEPFEGVAPALAQRLAQIIFELKQEGMAVLIADSNEQHVRDLIDRTFMIERGAISVRAS